MLKNLLRFAVGSALAWANPAVACRQPAFLIGYDKPVFSAPTPFSLTKLRIDEALYLKFSDESGRIVAIGGVVLEGDSVLKRGERVRVLYPDEDDCRTLFDSRSLLSTGEIEGYAYVAPSAVKGYYSFRARSSHSSTILAQKRIGLSWKPVRFKSPS